MFGVPREGPLRACVCILLRPKRMEEVSGVAGHKGMARGSLTDRQCSRVLNGAVIAQPVVR